jgi:hypothetical protein
LFLSNDPKARRRGSPTRIFPGWRSARGRPPTNWIPAWIADNRVEVQPSRKGWRRRVRRIIANRKDESASITGTDNNIEPESEVNEPNAYIALVREHGDRFIAILQTIRDTSPDSRARLAAATCLAEFDCEVPGAEAEEPIATLPVVIQRPTYTLEQLDAAVAEGSAVIVAQFGQAAPDAIVAMTEHV